MWGSLSMPQPFQFIILPSYNSRLTPWRWRQHGPPKRWYPTTLHDITTQKTEDGGIMDIRNVDILPQYYIASQIRRPRLESSPPWKSQNPNRDPVHAYIFQVVACLMVLRPKLFMFFLFHACYMSGPHQSPSFNIPDNISSRVQTVKLIKMKLSSSSCCFPLFKSKRPPQHPVLKCP
jgi:hypothetical protein